MHDLDIETVLDHYIIAALWSSTDDDDIPLDKNYTKDDLAESALSQMRKDVTKFVNENHADIALWNGPGSPEEQAGYDFWFNRNRHGVGFWEKEWTGLPTNPGERLDNASVQFGEVYLYVGEDGYLYAE